MKPRMISWTLALVVGAACAAGQPRVKPDDTSAADHREAARHERELAQKNATLYDPAAVRVSPMAAPGAGEGNVEHMRCHYAYARSHAFDARVTCPLYMPGITIRRAGEMGVEITAPDKAHVEELRGRSREEAVFAKQEGK